MKANRKKHYETGKNWVIKQQCRWLIWRQQGLEQIGKTLGNNKGMGIVEIALIIVVIVALAFAFKDNRAFCKYICPITVFLKPMTYFSLMRITCNKEKCINCGKCKRVCPMNVDVTDNSRNRLNGTECIKCMECVMNCPKGAL